MTPEEFKRKLIRINSDPENTTECVHRAMDEVMCKVLEQLGYGEGVQIFKQTYKWYA